MRVLAAGCLFACNAIWRVTHLRSAGRALVRALGSQDEDLQTIAGMFLVQAGRRAEPLLEEALQRREGLPMVLTVSADIGDRRYEPQLLQFMRDSDPRIAEAAEDALRVLDTHH